MSIISVLIIISTFLAAIYDNLTSMVISEVVIII